ncbi:hypothetical protein [Tessaracoccus flavus]|nr:hypothetical protein [Tessaracoccus flavus]SDZ16355.1 hypothetical protein SAMN05428934_11318 [Tessaracoccus flavus]
MEILQLVFGVALVIVLALVLRVLIVRAFGLRLTDWIGYVACAAGVVAIPSIQWDISPWLLLGVPVALALALWKGKSTVDAWRRGEPVEGIFTFSPPPPGVVDRFRA